MNKMNSLKKQILKVKFLKYTLEIQKIDCFALNNQFNKLYSQVDSNYNEINKINYYTLEKSFDTLPDDKLNRLYYIFKEL